MHLRMCHTQYGFILQIVYIPGMPDFLTKRIFLILNFKPFHKLLSVGKQLIVSRAIQKCLTQ